ncbi:MAG: hypothetical protein IID15_02430 [Candidatus Marinimicrobia bacterium]|nr:hypothetical protein [Candidatus Neomarinimicrobiota bacterium]
MIAKGWVIPNVVGFDGEKLDTKLFLGSALAADINSGFLAITNPASVVYHRRREFGLSYLYLPLDRSVQTLNFAIALPPRRLPRSVISVPVTTTSSAGIPLAKKPARRPTANRPSV